MTTTTTTTSLLPFQPDAMTPAQRAAVSYLARYTGHTHTLYAYQLLRRWFGWCETNDLDPLVGIERAHIELYIRPSASPGSWPPQSAPQCTRSVGSSGSPTSTA